MDEWLDKIMKNLILVVCVFFTHTTLAQNLTGKVVDETNEPLPSVIVRTSNTTTYSSVDGEYNIDLTDSPTTVTFSFMGYNDYVIETTGGVLDVKLKPQTLMIDDVEIVARKNNSSETVLLVERKELTGIETSIGSQEMSKKGISNAQNGLKKVTGITFTTDRLNIRGLDDRYNQVTLNGIPLPSNNSDKKNIDLSLLPIGVMDNMKVKKSYSSDQWSNVSGAQINISTSDIKKGWDVSYRTSMNTQTPIPNSNLNISYGNNKSKKFGVFFNTNLIHDNQYTDGVMRLANKQGNTVLDYNFKERLSQLTPSSIVVLSYNGNNFTLKNVTMFISQSSVSDRKTEGTHFDYTKELHTTRVTPTRHTLFTEQVKGELNVGKWDIEGIGSLSLVNSGERGRQQFVYLYDGNFQFNNVDKLDNHNFWNQNKEDRTNLSFFARHNGKTFKNEFGYSFMLSNNDFDYQQQYYDLLGVNNENVTIDPNNPFDFINENNSQELWVNNPSSKVNGTTTIHGGYYKGDMVNDKIDLSFGSRVENVYQLVRYRDQLSPVFIRYSLLDNLEVLPFVNLKYKINKKFQVKGSGSITTIRPRFREMTPFIYTEVFAGSKIQGNPDLINSTVYNSDVNFGWYPTRSEMVEFNLYSKVIKNPIERVNVATASGRLETYQNSTSSTVFGGEFEIKKKYKKMTFDYNISLLWSNISTSDSGSSSVVVTNLDRPLQGSSPILSNFDVFYKINRQSNFGFTYNYVGRKLNSVGVFGLGDIYQSPQHFLNVIYNIEKPKYGVSFRVNNLLNSEYRLSQKTDIGNITTNSFRTGQDISIRFKYKF